MASTQGIRAGRAFVELFADDTKLVRSLRRAEKRLRAFGAKVRNLGLKLTGLGTALAAPLGIATRVFAGFDDQMRAIQAVLGATGEQFERLTAKAQHLGRTTSYTAAQVAGAMLELARAGFDTDQIDAAIGSVLALARASGTDLAEASNIAAGALRAFGLEADQMGRVADVLSATANNSAQTLTDLGEAMKYAAPVADAYGLTIEQTAKALGALANFGIKGSMAGNTLKQVMLQLANPAVRKQIEGLGVAVTDASGNFRDVGSILADLGGAIAKLPRPDRLALMDQLFGKRAIAGGIKLTTAAFQRLNDAIDNANGTAARTAKVMDSGIGGSMRRLWSAVEGVAIAVGQALAPILTDLAEKLSGLTTQIAAWIQANVGVIQTALIITAAILGVGIALTALGGVISAVGTALGVLSTIVTTVGTVFGILGAILGWMLTPIGAVIAALAALGGYLIYSTGAGAKALGWLGEKFGVLRDDATKAYEGIANAIAAGDIGLAAKVLWLTLKMEWTRGINFLEKAWLNFRNFFIRIGYDAWHGLLAIVEIVWHALEVGWIETVAFFKKLWSNVTTFFARTWEGLKSIAKKAWHWIKGLFSKSARESKDRVYAEIDRARDAAIRKIEDENKRDLAAAEAERQRRREQSDAVHDATMTEIGRQNLQKHRELDQEYNQRMKENEGDLDAARKEWQDALDEARRKRDAAGGKREDDAPERMKGPEELVAKANEMLGKLNVGDMLNQTAKIGATGTFNASNVLGLQAGGVMDRMTIGIEKIERNTRPMRDAEGIAFE